MSLAFSIRPHFVPSSPYDAQFSTSGRVKLVSRSSSSGVSHGSAIVGVVEVSSSLSGVFIGCNGRHGEASCVIRFIPLLSP